MGPAAEAEALAGAGAGLLVAPITAEAESVAFAAEAAVGAGAGAGAGRGTAAGAAWGGGLGVAAEGVARFVPHLLQNLAVSLMNGDWHFAQRGSISICEGFFVVLFCVLLFFQCRRRVKFNYGCSSDEPRELSEQRGNDAGWTKSIGMGRSKSEVRSVAKRLCCLHTKT